MNRFVEAVLTRRGRRIAPVTAAAVLAAAGITAGASAAGQSGGAAGQHVTARLTYACSFPFGVRTASVEIGATFPATATVGAPVQPSAASVGVTLPPAAVTGLTGLHAATVKAAATLTTDVSEGGRSAASPWRGFAVPITPVPRTGSLTLSAPGTAAPATATAPGTVSFAAAGLSLVLTPYRADGTATDPASLEVRCWLRPGQAATFASVTVAARAGAPAPSPAAGVPAHAHSAAAFCPPLRKALKLNPRFPPPPPPPGSVINHSPGLPPYCAYAAGYADAAKLRGASLIGPGLTNISPFLNSIFNFSHNYFQQDSAGELSYHGLREFPPASATLLGFGFEPTSAELHLAELGTVNIVTVGPLTACSGPSCQPTITTVSSRMVIRITNVTVNGVPLNAGPHCQTAPFNVIVKGSSQSKPPYTITLGGPLAGNITIPPFTGCGSGENLDPLFSSTISGQGNFTLLTQGPTCEQGPPPFQCPPRKPVPLHSFR